MIKDLMGDGGRSLFFLILSFGCLWVILDLFYGKKTLVVLVDNIFDGDSKTDGITLSKGNETETKKTEKKAAEKTKTDDDKKKTESTGGGAW